MKKIKAIIASLALFAMFAGTAAQAKVEIQWWHAFGGRLGELLDEQVNKFNASQDKYTVVHTRKGNYSETLNACLLYTSPSPRDLSTSRMPSSA